MTTRRPSHPSHNYRSIAFQEYAIALQAQRYMEIYRDRLANKV